VAVFFTLSGFLITGLLLAERENIGRISLPDFYARRAKRLLPALVGSTVVIALIGVWLGPWWLSWQHVPPALFYYANWVKADPTGELGALSATWSLSVEEQFYFVWPALLMLVAPAGRKAVALTGALGVTLSLLARLMAMSTDAGVDRIYYGSDTVAFALLAGSALVAWRGLRPTSRMRMGLCMTGCVLVAWVCVWPAGLSRYIGLPVVTIGTLVVLYACTGEGRFRPLEGRVLKWFGQRSYGIYLWHSPLAWALREHLGWSWPALVITVVPVSLMFAEASFRFLERPWLNRPPRALEGTQNPRQSRQSPSGTLLRESAAAGTSASLDPGAGPSPAPVDLGKAIRKLAP
jgi:peptidoglycan/LPS O-acetylase OafA/YrhL